MDDDRLRKPDQTMVETLIVGFGFSVIPLLRELELREQPYTIISAGPSIWEQLAAADRLDFDLVSSFHSSYYSFTQVEHDIEEDYYPTAREFYEHQLKLFAPYREKLIADKVVFVENFDDHSIVECASGRVYHVRNLVFATGLGRPQNETIKDFDTRGVTGKTVVFGTMGDTANMMIARLVPQGNRVILLNNGFMALDKTVFFEMPGPKDGPYLPVFGIRTGRRYSLDLAQYESHEIGYYFPRLYKEMFMLVQGMPAPTSAYGRLVTPHHFPVRYPQTWRAEALGKSMNTKAAVRNGLISLKHWPIDMYKNRFEGELDEAIRAGSLMNDIAFFHTEGLVESWPKERATVDIENKTLCYEGELLSFDHYIGAGYEAPRLPEILLVDEQQRRHRYQYNYMHAYMGVVPKELRNVYFVGYTRPYTGGLANVTEMQCLLVHKLISSPQFRAEVYTDIQAKVRAYNDYYYPHKHLRASTDHLVHFGLYTGDIARLLGIDRKLRDCLSWRPFQSYLNLRFDLLHPNSPMKFRMRGEYTVEGADQLAKKIAARNDYWAIMMFFFLSSLWDKLTAGLLLLLVYLRIGLQPLLNSNFDPASITSFALVTAVCTGLGVALHRNTRLLNVISYSTPMPLLGPKANLQPLAMAYAAYTGDWRICALVFVVTCGLAFLSRQFHLPPMSGRYLFGDCKFKHKYRPFWAEYQAVYEQVMAERSQASE